MTGACARSMEILGVSICTGFAYMPLKRARKRYKAFCGRLMPWYQKKIFTGLETIRTSYAQVCHSVCHKKRHF